MTDRGAGHDSPDSRPEATPFQHRNFAGLEPPYSDPEHAAAVILPVPYDATSEWHSGSRHGPQAIIDASRYLELYDLDLDRDIYRVGIATLPEVEPVLTSPQDMIGRVYHLVKSLVRAGKLVAMLGGEHSLSLGAVRALKEHYGTLSVLQLDAHADLRDEYLGTRYGQACVMRRINEVCPICQVGVRSLSREEKQFLNEKRMRPFYMSDLAAKADTMERIIDCLTEEDVYITIDADVLDPSIMPAVGTPEPDGMTWRQAIDVIRSVCLHRRVVGFDVMEFCPAQGPDSCAFLLAKLIYRLIGYTVPADKSITGAGR
jgi:agmatinase